MMPLRVTALIVIGLAEGAIVGSAVVAFLTVLGIIPRLAHLTSSVGSIRLYEATVIVATFAAALLETFEGGLHLPAWIAAPIGLLMGTFVGLTSSALAEVLNVIPALARNLKIQQAVRILISALLIGKVLGSLIYWLVPGLW